MKRLLLIIIGVILVTYSALVWVIHLKGGVAFFNNGPTSIFITAKVSPLGNIINLLIFVIGFTALAVSVFFMKKKSRPN
jgi:formate hydrogenlyase subunit 3/multisubunit Na+/H+ antiporter MnhD subunit